MIGYIWGHIKADWHCATHRHQKAKTVQPPHVIWCHDCRKQFYPPVPRTANN